MSLWKWLVPQSRHLLEQALSVYRTRENVHADIYGERRVENRGPQQVGLEQERRALQLAEERIGRIMRDLRN